MNGQVKTHAKAPAVTMAAPAVSVFQARPFGAQSELDQSSSFEHDASGSLGSYLQRRAAGFAADFGSASSQMVIQPKLALGSVGDKYEQEADQVAKQIVGQREESHDEAPRTSNIQPVTTADGLTVDSGIEGAINRARGGGQPLAEHIRAPMERAFGADFSGVRVHTGEESDTLNRSLEARAFTTGQDLFFKQGEYQPSRTSGQELIAHELTHVMQQMPGATSLGQEAASHHNAASSIQTKLVIQRDYDEKTNTYKKRPPRSAGVEAAMNQAKQVGSKKGYTAHHKVDYSVLRDEILDALNPPGNLQKLENIAQFAGISVPSDIRKELGKPFPRSAQFGNAVNNFMNDALWPPLDIFPGVLSEQRADDPTKTGAPVDLHYTRSGHTTPKSELARDIVMYRGGFGGIDPQELSARLNALPDRNASQYDDNEWKFVGTKKTKKGEDLDQYQQRYDPQHWSTPQSEIVFPKNNEKITSSYYPIHISANSKTNQVQVKVQRVGTTGRWQQARVDHDVDLGPNQGWVFDWKATQSGEYEIMARASGATGQKKVSRLVRVKR